MVLVVTRILVQNGICRECTSTCKTHRILKVKCRIRFAKKCRVEMALVCRAFHLPIRDQLWMRCLFHLTFTFEFVVQDSVVSLSPEWHSVVNTIEFIYPLPTRTFFHWQRLLNVLRG